MIVGPTLMTLIIFTSAFISQLKQPQVFDDTNMHGSSHPLILLYGRINGLRLYTKCPSWNQWMSPLQMVVLAGLQYNGTDEGLLEIETLIKINYSYDSIYHKEVVPSHAWIWKAVIEFDPDEFGMCLLQPCGLVRDSALHPPISHLKKKKHGLNLDGLLPSFNTPTVY